MPAETQVERELDAIDAALGGRPVDPDLAELAELARLLRDDRTEIDPFFARELDARAAAGFPRERRWRRAFRAGPLLVPGVAASMLLAVVVSVALLSSPAGEERSVGGGALPMESAPQDGASEALEASSADEAARARPQSATGGGAGSAAAMAPAPVPGSGSPRSDSARARKVETSAALVLATAPGDVQPVADRIVAITDGHGGFVVRSAVNATAGGGGATFELRVPSDRLKAALADLSRAADVRERTEATQDITREFVSARSRLADARAERRGLLRQLERADSDDERARVKAQLRRVGYRISTARRDLARVRNRDAYSTIAVTLVGDAAAGEDDGAGIWTPGDAARDAVRVLEVAAGIALIALALALPLGLLALLAAVLVRMTARRRRERLLDAV